MKSISRHMKSEPVFTSDGFQAYAEVRVARSWAGAFFKSSLSRAVTVHCVGFNLTSHEYRSFTCLL